MSYLHDNSNNENKRMRRRGSHFQGEKKKNADNRQSTVRFKS